MRLRTLGFLAVTVSPLFAACGGSGSDTASDDVHTPGARPDAGDGGGSRSDASTGGNGGGAGSDASAGGDDGSSGAGGASADGSAGASGGGGDADGGGASGAGGGDVDAGECDADVSGDVNNCGSCGHVCPGGPNGEASCFGGQCFFSCDTGFGDCNDDAADGCEVDTTSDKDHCGSCTTSCGSAQCLNGACQCAGSSVKAEQIPLDMYIMLDYSGSMSGTKWTSTTTALKGFIQDPKSAGLGVGLQYFALAPPAPKPCPTGIGVCNAQCDACGGTCSLWVFCTPPPVSTTSCNADDYANPAVEIAPLPGNATTLVNSIGAHSNPNTGTPTAPALKGAIQHARAWQLAHPTHKAIAVLATDGIPEACSPTDIPSIAQIAANGVSGTPNILTFVIGVGSSLKNLNAIAASGGTSNAFIVDTTGNITQQFQDALDQIRGQALGCEYGIPKPSSGTPDYATMNVQYTPSNGAPGVLTFVGTEGNCGAATGGWYYDSITSPTKILLCPTTCGAVQGDKAGEVEILLGCATKQ